VGSYLAYQGEKFVERFDANSYVTLSLAMDLFSLGESHEALVKRFRKSHCAWLVLSFSSDWLFPPFQSKQMVDALLAAGRRVASCTVESRCGHDAFLLEDDLDRYGEMVAGFLDRLADGVAFDALAEPESEHEDPTSIFQARRIDYDLIEELIDPGASVLDLGCGGGGLLARLASRGQARLVGIELDEREIVTAIRRGVPVVQADLAEGLACFHDGEFDAVVLSQTLQTVEDVETVVAEMLRVGRRCIVSFPNVAHAPLRRRLAEDGLAPVPAAPGTHHWYDTPNIRSLSISDFEAYCAERRIRVLRRLALDSAAGKRVSDDPNLNADLAVFVIAR
jgi:homoserine O-acetyltransferase